jgi:hypothetical protein
MDVKLRAKAAGAEDSTQEKKEETAVAVRIKDATDFFIEEFGDTWPLEMVKFGHDDGGRVLEIFLPDPRAGEMRLAIPPKYRGFCTVIIACPADWGKGITFSESVD